MEQGFGVRTWGNEGTSIGLSRTVLTSSTGLEPQLSFHLHFLMDNCFAFATAITKDTGLEHLCSGLVMNHLVTAIIFTVTCPASNI